MLETVQKQKIIELRSKGYGYGSIALILKIKRDDVRDFCRRNNLDGYLGYGLSMPCEGKRRPINIPNHCEYCGQTINQSERRGRKSRFCSDRCRREWWNEHPEKKERRETAWYPFICLYCGKDFKAYGNRNRKFCSVKCTLNYRFGSYRGKTGDR